MHLRTHLIAASALALALTATGAHAETAATEFEVTVTITSTCSIGVPAATGVHFGSVASTATAVDTAGRLEVNCTPGTGYQIALDAGRNAGGDIQARAMTGGGITVPYQLYQDENRSIVWGSTDQTDTVGGTGTGSVQEIRVYGRLPSANFAAGSYADTITATVSY